MSTFPMLTSYQRTSIWESFGTFCFSGRDGEVEKVKIYSTLGHALKAFGMATNFGTLPKTVRQMQRRVSQARQFWHFTRGFEMFGEMVSTTRVEVTIQKNSHTCHDLKRGVASWLRNCGWVRVPPDPRRTLRGRGTTPSRRCGHTFLNTRSCYEEFVIRRKSVRRPPPQCIRYVHCRHTKAFDGGGRRTAISLSTTGSKGCP